MPANATLVPTELGPTSDTIGLSHVFDMHYGLRGPIDIGTTPNGRRVYFSTSGGVFEGPNIKGTVLPEGVDWTLTGANLVASIDAGVILKTDDSELILGRWLGKMRATPSALASLADPEKRADIDPASVYFRTLPIFETGSEKYAWLTQHVFVASAQFTREGISYRVMRVD